MNFRAAERMESLWVTILSFIQYFLRRLAHEAAARDGTLAEGQPSVLRPLSTGSLCISSPGL